jgi:hypothetical protein
MAMNVSRSVQPRCEGMHAVIGTCNEKCRN